MTACCCVFPSHYSTVLVAAFSGSAYAHGVTGRDAAFVQSIDGPAVGPFLYLGAKHMVTGYDHLLFLVGVIFFLYRLKDVVLYVSLFTIGHSVTLLAGVLGGIHANATWSTRSSALSVVYKAFENMGGFERCSASGPIRESAVLVFGLFHGFGLATKLQDFALSPERAGHQHRQLQRRRRDRPDAGVDGGAHPRSASGARDPGFLRHRSRRTRC